MKKPIRCYGQYASPNIVQEVYETASRDAGRRVRQLRKAGFQAVSSPMGPQVTPVGVVKLTMVTIFTTESERLPTDNWKLIRL